MLWFMHMAFQFWMINIMQPIFIVEYAHEFVAGPVVNVSIVVVK